MCVELFACVAQWTIPSLSFDADPRATLVTPQTNTDYSALGRVAIILLIVQIKLDEELSFFIIFRYNSLELNERRLGQQVENVAQCN